MARMRDAIAQGAFRAWQAAFAAGLTSPGRLTMIAASRALATPPPWTTAGA